MELTKMNRLQLIEFIEKINEIFEKEMPPGTGDYYKGYKSCYEQLKREIYDE